MVPLSRSAVNEANDRVRAATPQYHLPGRNTQIDTLAVQRHRARTSGRGDFASIGEYLDHLAKG